MATMRNRPWLLCLLLALLCGCPNGDPVTPTPPATDGGGDEVPDPAPDADPLAGSIFSKEDLFAIYSAEQAGGEDRDAALKKHKLIDASGNDVPLRVKAYERALGDYATKDPEGWSAFLETLPR